MVIILPDKIDGLSAIINNLETVSADCSTRLTQTYEREVQVYLPKFRTETKLDLGDTLSTKVYRNISRMIHLPVLQISYTQLLHLFVTAGPF